MSPIARKEKTPSPRTGPTRCRSSGHHGHNRLGLRNIQDMDLPEIGPGPPGAQKTPPLAPVGQGSITAPWLREQGHIRPKFENALKVARTGDIRLCPEQWRRSGPTALRPRFLGFSDLS